LRAGAVALWCGRTKQGTANCDLESTAGDSLEEIGFFIDRFGAFDIEGDEVIVGQPWMRLRRHDRADELRQILDDL
jgi:hypothetical protein